MKIKPLLSTLTALAFAHAAAAQEPLPLDEAQKAARKLDSAAGNLSDTPFAGERDLDKPQGIKTDKGGLIVIPDQRLSAEKLAAAGDAVVPVGELWTLSISVAAQGKPAPKDKVRLVTVPDDEKSREVQLYFLGASKDDKGALQLVVFAKGKEPLVRVPLIQVAAGTTQQFPIELAGRKEDDDTGTLSLRLFGQYKADLTVVRPAE